MNEITATASRGESAQPAPYTDRRALSEAWYRALFDSRSGHERGGNERAAGADPGGTARPLHRRNDAAAASQRTANSSASLPARARVLRSALVAESRIERKKQPGAPSPRPIWRDASSRRTLCRTLLPGRDGVDLLVQQRGDRLRLVAIYDGRDASHVTTALLRARVALLARGLRVELDVRQKGTS